MSNDAGAMEDAGPLVSIITPTLNQAYFLPDALESVAKQSYRAIEHVVVDGGSTDGTLDLLRGWKSKPNRQWISGPDRGMYSAINKGLRRIRGEIVGYLNSDDILLPWAVHSIVRAFHARPSLDIVYGDALSLVEADRHLMLSLQVPFSRARIARFGSLVQPSVFWRRAVHEQLEGFDPDLMYVGDLDFWLRAARSSSVGHIEEVLSIYRVHAGALTSTMRGPMRAEEHLVRARHHRDGRLTSVGQLLARLSQAVAARKQLLRFAAATRRMADPRWQQFRSHMSPRVRPVELTFAMLPLLSRFVDIRWVEVSSLPDGIWVRPETQP